MIKHISIGDESIGLIAIDIDAKDTTRDHHAELTVLFQGELPILWHRIANCIVILLNVLYFLGYLLIEWTSLKQSSFLN